MGSCASNTGLTNISNFTQLANNIALTTTTTDKTISSIAGKHNVLLLGKVNTTIRGSLLIPYSVLASAVDCNIPVIGGTVTGTVYVKYVSDTSIKVKASDATFNYLDIYVN